MGEIFVVVEHRTGEIREITFQMLWKANELCKNLSHNLTAVLLGGKDEPFVNEIAERADKVIVVEDEKLKHFNGDLYKEILLKLIEEYHPFMTLIGQTPWGMDLAPSISVRTRYPLATDCVDIVAENGRLAVIRQIYSGKIFSKVSFKESEGYLITVRPGSFPPDKAGERKGEVIKKEIPAGLPEARKQFLEFVEAGVGAIDISQADLLVSIGRGIGEEGNIAAIKELAGIMGGVISCSRPIVDKNWLPKYHQVGTSGKSVKPKVYLAFGISGAFQHVAGLTGAGTIIAINKDSKAPIFRVADYGVVDDLFKIADALKEKLKT
ncbi:MAG: electron transfer flavoprotein subunit alpha/FixB family protein [Pseudomonadota bacterium]